MRRRTRPVRAGRILLGLSLCLTGPLAVHAADDGPISTDRPDQTDSTDTQPARTFQVEIGWQRTTDQEAGERVESDVVGGTLLRYGLAERLELRLGWIGQIDQTVASAGVRHETSGASDGSLGVKWRLRDAEGARPAVALEARVGLPVGAREVSTRRADPAFLLLVQHEVSDRLSLGWNAGVAWTSQEAARGERTTRSRLLASASLGISFSARWGGFVELFGDRAGSAPGGSTISADAGVLWLVTRRFQLDLYAGQALASAAADRFYGFGLAFRLPS